MTQSIDAGTLSEDLSDWPPLTRAYRKLLDELGNNYYAVRTVFDHYVTHGGVANADKPTVVVRIDVDSGFHLSWPLALALNSRGLTASHFFLPHPNRYYDLWVSDIPRRISGLGQEVGIHSDHYYEQLTEGADGLANLKRDIARLNDLIGGTVHGMVAHGHPAMNELGRLNWELTRDVDSSELGLSYHDGLRSCYIQSGSDSWKPSCDARISDYLGLPNSWGWNYVAGYPVEQLRKLASPGKTFHLAFHTLNAFEYWRQPWPRQYAERPVPKEPWTAFQRKRLFILRNLAGTYVVQKIPPAIRQLVKRVASRRHRDGTNDD